MNLDLTKSKYGTINLRAINVSLNGDAESQQELMFKKKARDNKNGRWKKWLFASNKTKESKHSKKVKQNNEKKHNNKMINSTET